ncbi:hypothetical protein B0H16DRAFT_1684184 [Mycena metata]|uniref:Uncharacterized protein n=1 Tax=Mycena metata TaxID=1033252 RepID=A0AAD7K3A7_9AGAR|nr:hypothetical protein B0H16DRAFT_1684184 [Mycena metata]
MPASNSKDHVTIVGVREVPPHLSTEVFVDKMGALMDALMALPVCKKNFRKWDLIVPVPSLFDSSIRAIGFPASQRHVLTVSECETNNHWVEVLSDPEVTRLVMEADTQFGFCSTAQTFFADVVTGVDALGSLNSARSFWIIKAPSQSSRDKLGGFVDRLFAMPISQKALHKHSFMGPGPRSTDTLLKRLGLPVPDSVVVIMADHKSLNDAIELWADPAVHQLTVEATAELDFHVNGVAFLGDVESKVN